MMNSSSLETQKIRQPLSGIHEVICTLGWEVYQMTLRTGGDVGLVYFSFLALRKMLHMCG